MSARRIISPVDCISGTQVAKPMLTLTGSGKAWILRNGMLIAGTWSRPIMGAVTKFVTKTGDIIPLAPGNTWIELVAKGTPPTVTK